MTKRRTMQEEHSRDRERKRLAALARRVREIAEEGRRRQLEVRDQCRARADELRAQSQALRGEVHRVAEERRAVRGGCKLEREHTREERRQGVARAREELRTERAISRNTRERSGGPKARRGAGLVRHRERIEEARANIEPK